jgi:magnesium transporter
MTEEVVEPTEISERVDEKGQLLWVDVADPSPDDIATLVREFQVHSLAADDLLERSQRPRLVQYPSHGVLYVKDCVVGRDGLEVRDIDVVFGDGWVVTIQRSVGHKRWDVDPADGMGPIRATPPVELDEVAEEIRSPISTDEIARRFERQRHDDGVTDEGFFLAVLLDHLVGRYFDVIDIVEDRFEGLEEAVFDADQAGGDIQRRLFRHRTVLLVLRRAVSPLREAVSSLSRGEVSDFSEVAQLHLRDVHDNLVRLVEIVESQRELLSGAIEANVAMISLRLNVLTKRLTAWGAILVAATFVTGVYGMNFEHMPELGWELGYPAALGTILVITGTLYVIFKRHDWL